MGSLLFLVTNNLSPEDVGGAWAIPISVRGSETRFAGTSIGFVCAVLMKAGLESDEEDDAREGDCVLVLKKAALFSKGEDCIMMPINRE